MRLFPRTILDAHPVIGGMRVVVLFGSAATVAVLCPAGAVLFGCVGLFMGGWASLAFSDHPRRPRWVGPWLISGSRRERMRKGGPYYWRWGVISLVLGLAVIPFGGLVDCEHGTGSDSAAHHVIVGS